MYIIVNLVTYKVSVSWVTCILCTFQTTYVRTTQMHRYQRKSDRTLPNWAALAGMCITLCVYIAKMIKFPMFKVVCHISKSFIRAIIVLIISKHKSLPNKDTTKYEALH